MLESGGVQDHSGVLVVDDEEEIREALREVVELVGCSPILAENGAEALKIMAQRRPCLVILDLFMPVMTGQEMLHAMQQDPHLAGVPIVISTSSPSHAPAGLPVVPKPIDVPKLCRLIEQSCRCGQPATAAG
jgi:CheY-like chemotaxis protein